MKIVLLLLFITNLLLYASEKIPTEKEIVRLYVATFNKAPSNTILMQHMDQNISYYELSKSFFEEKEIQELYPTDLSNRYFIQDVYQNIFKRYPTKCERNHWKTELEEGHIAKDIFIPRLISEILKNGEEKDKAIINNKTKIGLLYARSKLASIDYARSIIDVITEDKSSVDTAFATYCVRIDTDTHNSDKDKELNKASESKYTLLAWNDLGMHCFDGSDFSVFSILPPYNNLNAHLIIKNGEAKKHVKKDVFITYESLEYNKTINTRSSDKTNFWDYLPSLFPGAQSVKEVGLKGNKTPSKTPSPMSYNEKHNWWEAEGIPITNKDDSMKINHYPMVRVVAKSKTGEVLATTDVVLPVSDEMDCAQCHASTVSINDAKPKAGWENNPDKLKDYKLNILKLHDQEYPINAEDLSEVNAKGYKYQSSLLETAKSGTPILCAACHSSNALGTTSIGKAQSLTAAIHSKHAKVLDPVNNMELGHSDNRRACYSCHPGEDTDCLRGAMGHAKNEEGEHTMQCQSCHGTMYDVGNEKRKGWLDQPNCQVCHQETKRHESAIVNGTLRAVIDNQFGTNPNTPAQGISLYRYSTGHGDLQCSACHGSTHAIFPTNLPQDNIYSQKIQGHSGTIGECLSCHTRMPKTKKDGPHGMHSIGQAWVDDHELASKSEYARCEKCHGEEYEGTALSKSFSDRVYKVDDKTILYPKGKVVNCYDCHGKKW